MKKLIAFALVVIAALAGVYMADRAGWIDIDPGPAPRADSLFQVRFLDTSDTDRSELTETISTDGHGVLYAMNDNDIDGLGDVNLDATVTNANVGGADELWAFSAEITFVDFTFATGGSSPNHIVNSTDFNSRWDVTWSMTDVCSPTISQISDKASSKDWKTGMTDQLNIDLRMNNDATNDVAAADDQILKFVIGGIEMVVTLRESA